MQVHKLVSFYDELAIGTATECLTKSTFTSENHPQRDRITFIGEQAIEPVHLRFVVWPHLFLHYGLDHDGNLSRSIRTRMSRLQLNQLLGTP